MNSLRTYKTSIENKQPCIDGYQAIIWSKINTLNESGSILGPTIGNSLLVGTRLFPMSKLWNHCNIPFPRKKPWMYSTIIFIDQSIQNLFKKNNLDSCNVQIKENNNKLEQVTIDPTFQRVIKIA